MKKTLLTLLGWLALSTVFSQTVLLTENFTAEVLPTGWSNDSLGLPGTMLWQFTNPKPRVITGAGFDTSFAILDSDLYGTGNSENASLTTASFSTVGFLQANLTFSEQFEYYLPSSNDVSYSTDNGVTWTSLRHDSANLGYPNPAVATTIALPAGAINQANVKIKFTYVATWGWWWAIDNIKVLGLNNCTGTPTAGTISGCPSTICPNAPFDLQLNGASQSIGITYQWMSSTNGTTYTPIAGATGMTYHDSVSSAPMYYEVVVTCTLTSTTATTTPVSVTTVNPAYLCYCLPIHPACLGDFMYDLNVIYTPLNNFDSVCTSASNGAYTQYPQSGNTTAAFAQGVGYTFNITTNSNNIISVWIDFNQNGVFEPSEWTQVCTTSVSGVVNTATVTISPTALLGTTGMRIRSRAMGNTNDSTSACLTFGSGECEDYLITIVGATNIQKNNLANFNLVPNPAQNTVNVVLSNAGATSVISITDLMGNEVASPVTTNKSNTSLNISDLSNGVYLVNITNEHGNTVKKLVISK